MNGWMNSACGSQAVYLASILAKATTTGSRSDRRTAKMQYARFMSVAGKTAYHWLGTIPKESRLTIVPVWFPGHLFKIAIQFRCGFKCVRPEVVGTTCKCKCRKTGCRLKIDAYGWHLTACAIGGWRTGRHDFVNEKYAWGCKSAGNDVCITRTDKLIQSLPSHAIDKGRRRQIRIPDSIITTPMGEVQLTDAMITRVHETAKQPLVNAKKAEKGKINKYTNFKQACEEEDARDPRLTREVIPIVFESHGAAAPAAVEHMALMRHHFGHLVLPVEDKSSTQTFFATWVHQISTALQLGNAKMIHNIPLGNRCNSRLQGDLQVDSTQQEVEKYLLKAHQSQPGTSPDSEPDSDAGEAATASDEETAPDETSADCRGSERLGGLDVF